MVPVMIKLHDMASLGGKNQVLALPSMGKHCVSVGDGTAQW